MHSLEIFEEDDSIHQMDTETPFSINSTYECWEPVIQVDDAFRYVMHI